MTAQGQSAFRKLTKLGAPVQTSVWNGVEFKLDLVDGCFQQETWAISPESKDRRSRRLRRKGWKYGLNPKFARILKNHHLTASWQSDHVLNVYVEKGEPVNA